MITIFKDDLFKSIKSVRTIIVLILFIGTVFLTNKYGSNLPVISANGNVSILSIIFAVFSIFGILFSFIIFGGTIVKEVEDQSIRYLLPYISRTKILISKFLSMFVFWLLVIAVSILMTLLMQSSTVFPYQYVLNLAVYFLYVSSLVTLTSVVLSKEKLVSFTGIVLGIVVPVIGSWGLVSHNLFLKVISWVLPFRYVDATWQIFILIGVSLIVFLGASILFKNKEL